jgi:phosphate transport system substrate-binding protein
MKCQIVIGSLIGGALLLAAGSAGAGELSYVGSSTVGKFINDAKGLYTASTFKVDTKPESSGGESCSIRKSCDLGGVARDIGGDYTDQGVVGTLIGHDAIAAIVHNDNPVQDLSFAQLTGIFTGAITNWSEVGGPDAPIKALIVKKGSATRNVFQDRVMGGAEYAGTEVVTPDARIVSEVARDPTAIGQISLAFVIGETSVKALAVDGQAADPANTAYPVTRPLYLTTLGAPEGEAKAFIDWALSDDGQAVVHQRFVGVR